MWFEGKNTMIFRLLKIAKILLSDVNYFKLPENLLNDTYQKFKKYNNKLDQNSPHILLQIQKDQLNKYFKNYKFKKNTNINKIQIFFFNILNNKKQIIGDSNKLNSNIKHLLKIICKNSSIKGLTSNKGETIIIQNRKQFNIKNILQHELIHAIRMIFDLQNKKIYVEKQYLNQIKQMLLSDKQFPSLVTDCCNSFKNIQQFSKALKLIKQLEKFPLQAKYYILKEQDNQSILFLSLLKQHKPKKYNKVIGFIRSYLNK